MTTVTEPEPTAEALPLLEVHIRQVTQPEFGVALAVLVMPATLQAGLIFDSAIHDDLSACQKHLETVRAEFMESGSGQEYRRRCDRLKAAQAEIDRSEKVLAELKASWTAAVASEQTQLVADLESRINQQVHIGAIFTARLPVLRGEVERLGPSFQSALKAALTTALAAFLADAEAEVEAARITIREAVNELFPTWRAAQGRLDGAKGMNLDKLLTKPEYEGLRGQR